MKFPVQSTALATISVALYCCYYALVAGNSINTASIGKYSGIIEIRDYNGRHVRRAWNLDYGPHSEILFAGDVIFLCVITPAGIICREPDEFWGQNYRERVYATSY